MSWIDKSMCKDAYVEDQDADKQSTKDSVFSRLLDRLDETQ